MDYKFSLVVPTIGRTTQLQLLLDSLLLQSYKFFEVIIVDQNEQNILNDIIESYKGNINIIHIKSNTKGLSKNRNIGVSFSNADIICFPDDDCTYAPDTLLSVSNFFNAFNEYHFYSCCVKDFNLNKKFRMANVDSDITRYNLFNRTISIGIFIKPVIKSDIYFDEKLGAGSNFGSAEESDFISSLIEKGYKGRYFANKFVYHAYPSINPDLNRYFKYAMGYGAFLKKEVVARKKYRLLINYFIKLAIRLVFSFLPWKKRKFIWMAFKGQLLGFVTYKIDKRIKTRKGSLSNTCGT